MKLYCEVLSRSLPSISTGLLSVVTHQSYKVPAHHFWEWCFPDCSAAGLHPLHWLRSETEDQHTNTWPLHLSRALFSSQITHYTSRALIVRADSCALMKECDLSVTHRSQRERRTPVTASGFSTAFKSTGDAPHQTLALLLVWFGRRLWNLSTAAIWIRLWGCGFIWFVTLYWYDQSLLGWCCLGTFPIRMGNRCVSGYFRSAVGPESHLVDGNIVSSAVFFLQYCLSALHYCNCFYFNRVHSQFQLWLGGCDIYHLW